MTELTFTLRDGVRWHDGKPFTAADAKCTWDMVAGLEKGKIRKSPRFSGGIERVSGEVPIADDERAFVVGIVNLSYRFHPR
jgi:peptide/nickel transport system substrate-binding protein